MRPNFDVIFLLQKRIQCTYMKKITPFFILGLIILVNYFVFRTLSESKDRQISALKNQLQEARGKFILPKNETKKATNSDFLHEVSWSMYKDPVDGYTFRYPTSIMNSMVIARDSNGVNMLYKTNNYSDGTPAGAGIKVMTVGLKNGQPQFEDFDWEFFEEVKKSFHPKAEGVKTHKTFFGLQFEHPADWSTKVWDNGNVDVYPEYMEWGPKLRIRYDSSFPEIHEDCDSLQYGAKLYECGTKITIHDVEYEKQFFHSAIEGSQLILELRTTQNGHTVNIEGSIFGSPENLQKDAIKVFDSIIQSLRFTG